MTRLFIMRHAKSSWTLPGMADKERTLNQRGRNDLPKISAALAKNGYNPAKILCSDAKRTQMTLDGISISMEPKSEVELLPDLYSGGVNDYLRIIQNQTGKDDLMIIGHNPTCASLVDLLSGTKDPEAASKIGYKYPTGAVSVIEFDIKDWSEISNGSGKLNEVIIPRAL